MQSTRLLFHAHEPLKLYRSQSFNPIILNVTFRDVNKRTSGMTANISSHDKHRDISSSLFKWQREKEEENIIKLEITIEEEI